MARNSDGALMNVVSLFSGIGGIELGLESSEHRTILQCEILPTAQAVLRHHFTDVPLESDVTRIQALPAETDLICAGFPCQDLSQAGKTQGLDGVSSGLISEVFRLVKAFRMSGHKLPTLLLENVPFMLQLNGGMAMRTILDALEAFGYHWAYRVVDTYSFGLPQRRERVYLVASVETEPAGVLLSDDAPMTRPSTNIGEDAHGFYWTEGRTGLGWAPNAIPTLKNGSTIGIPSPPAILLPSGEVIKPDLLDAERLQGFTENWTLPAEDVDRASKRWTLVGNAVSVPVAQWVGNRLQAPGTYEMLRDMPFPTKGKLPRAARGSLTERHAVSISTDPVGIQPQSLSEFLNHRGTPLSLRAISGFYSRTQRAKLRFPEGFIDAIRAHLAVMETA